jgi:hypothetical protein
VKNHYWLNLIFVQENQMKKFIFVIIVLALLAAGISIYVYTNNVELGLFTSTTENLPKGFNDKVGSWGALGDFFGGILNPFFTFLSITLISYTLYQNKRALEQNQEALEVNNQELIISSNALESSSEALHSQTIGNTFFNLLGQHNNIVNNLEFDVYTVKNSMRSDGSIRIKSSKKAEGRNVFSQVIKLLTGEEKRTYEITEKYKVLNATHNYILGHYFRNLFQIIKYIHEYSDLESERQNTSAVRQAQKENFMRMLRSQLSSEELLLLLINGLTNVVDQGQFKELLIEYSMLKHVVIDYHNTNTRVIRLNPNVLITENEFIEYFSPQKSAFGDNLKALEIQEKINNRAVEKTN